MPDRVLVTGATGFVGSHVAKVFVKAGYEVRCGMRTSSDPRWISGLPVERAPADLGRPEDLAEAVDGVDVVVHAAGITRARQANDYRLVNAEGARRLATAALGAGVRRFVFISSLAARGPDVPIEDGRDHPVSPYGQSKLEAEEPLKSFVSPMEAVTLRPAAVYGPRDTDMLPFFKMASIGWLPVPSGSGLLQPVYVGDLARAVLAAARKPALHFGPFPIAEAVRYSWRDIVEGLERALGHSIRVVRLPAAAFKLAGSATERAAKLRGSVPVFDERRAWDLAVHGWTCDTSGAERALGWRAEVPLYEGLERTARWYRQADWI